MAIGRNDPCPCGSGKKSKKCCSQKLGLSPADINQALDLYTAGSYGELLERAKGLTLNHPQEGQAWKILGIASHVNGQDAIAAFQKAAQLLPDDPEIYNNLGVALEAAQRFSEATESYQRATILAPGYPEAHNNLGNALRGLGQDLKAEHCYLRTLQLRPTYFQAHNNLGITLSGQGKLEEAIKSYQEAVRIQPDYYEGHSNLGFAWQRLGRFQESIASYRKALEIRPEYALAYSNLLYCLTQSEEIGPTELLGEHLAFAARFENPDSWIKHKNSPHPERALRVGFVSADLRIHALANFIEPILAHLSQEKSLSIYVYSNSNQKDAMTAKMQSYVPHWSCVAQMSDESLVETIQSDGIDVLIDLSGHTGANRLPVFARRPAPVQASWMGYPATTGLQAVDYYLADRHFLPLEPFSSQFSERLVHLPANAPFLGPEGAPDPNRLPALDHPMTFASFNELAKIRRPVVALWSEVLRALPQSRMLIAGMPQAAAYHSLLEWFSEEGIEPGRLDFRLRCDMSSYLKMHHEVDLCLDTFPYNGATTTCLAMWMGVPTITLAGSTGAGRPGAALLGHLNLGGFIADSRSKYVELALHWAGQLEALADLRGTLRARFQSSAVGRPDVIAQGLVVALREMWRRWCRGEASAPIEVSEYALSSGARGGG